MGLDLAKELSRFMDEKNLVELELEEEGFKVKIKKGPLSLKRVAYPEKVNLTEPIERERLQRSILESGLVGFTSTMVGTFYRRPEEGAAPYVQIGDEVKAGDLLCRIQAMGIKNEIKSNITGKVMDVLVEDGHPVEYGQELFFIKSLRGEADV